MRTLLLAVVLAASLGQQAKLRGTWIGTFQTEHGSGPLELTVAPSDSAATYRMTFMDTELRGPADGWKTAGDSLQFVIGFLSTAGAVEFRFAGVIKGSEASGNYIGSLDGQERGRGPWSITRQP
jgi:hypothetical protein